MAKRKIKAIYVKNDTYKKYEKAQAVLENSHYVKTKDEFLAKFALCEIACKSVIEHFNKIQGKKVNKKSIKLDMRTIPAAFEKFNYTIDKHILTLIFGSSELRGQKSAKKLRDCIIHALSEEDIIEVIERKMDIFTTMDLFLNIIKDGQVQDTAIQKTLEGEKVLMLV